MLASARHLLRLIDDVLDLTKIEAGHLEVALEPVVLAALLRETADALRPMIAANGNALVLDVPDVLPPLVTDPIRLRQVVINLLGNAGKFTHGGTVTLAAAAADGEFMIRVTDTGIGMSELQLGRLFAAFDQTDAAVARTYGGTGLGLAISRALVERLDGAIEVLSAPGAGSTFVVRLPLQSLAR